MVFKSGVQQTGREWNSWITISCFTILGDNKLSRLRRFDHYMADYFDEEGGDGKSCIEEEEVDEK